MVSRSGAGCAGAAGLRICGLKVVGPRLEQEPLVRHSLPALVSKPHCCSPMLIVPWPLFLPCAAIFFLIPNAYVLARKCTWFGSVVLWSGFVRCFGERGGCCVAGACGARRSQA